MLPHRNRKRGQMPRPAWLALTHWPGDGVFDFLGTPISRPQDLVFPKPENHPSCFAQLPVDFSVSGDVAFDLSNPETSASLYFLQLLFPFVSVPKMTVAKHRNTGPGKNEI